MKQITSLLLTLTLMIGAGNNAVAQNVTADIASLREAAERGDAEAQYDLGNCYYDGNGVVYDFIEAAKWYHKAAETFAHSQCRLGECYYKGLGVTQDFTEAIKWFREAANSNHVEALKYLSDCYRHGNGVPQDVEKANELRYKADYQEALNRRNSRRR